MTKYPGVVTYRSDGSSTQSRSSSDRSASTTR